MAGAGRHKVRLRRTSAPPPGSTLVIRALPEDRGLAVDDIVRQALDMAETYVDEHPDGRRAVLFSISVYERRPNDPPELALSRFPGLPLYAEVTVEAVRECGLDVLPLGADERHYELQLLPGVFEGDWPEGVEGLLRDAARRLLDRAEPFKRNPVYPDVQETP